MIETVLAVLMITSIFLALFHLSQLLTRKVFLEHAAMRVARARTVGLNDFMCCKAARIATIPISGERLWPTGYGDLDYGFELARIPDYLASEDDPHARAILEYAGWSDLRIRPGEGRPSRVSLENLEGEARLEANATYYMTDGGL